MYSSLNATFSALSDPTRRSILTRLSQGDATVSQLIEPFNMTQPAISKHIRVLKNAGLVSQEKDGRIRHCHLEAEPLKAAAEWVAEYKKFWEGRLDALADYIDDLDDEKETKQ